MDDRQRRIKESDVEKASKVFMTERRRFGRGGREKPQSVETKIALLCVP